jgi:outer membrane protein
MSRRFFVPLILALALPLATSAAPTTPSEMTVIYVDLDRIISDVDEGKIASAALSKEQQARQARISTLETKLKKLQDKVQALAGKGNSPALQQAGADYQQVALEYQQLITQSQKEMVDKEKELFDPIERRVKEVLRGMAVKEGVDIVFGRRAITYARSDFDYTEKVTQEYNKLHPAKGPVPTSSAKPAASSSAKPAPSASAKPAPSPSTKPAPPTSAKPATSAKPT